MRTIFNKLFLVLMLVLAVAGQALAVDGWDPTTGMTIDMTAPKAIAVLFIVGGSVIMYAIRKSIKTSNRV